MKTTTKHHELQIFLHLIMLLSIITNCIGIYSLLAKGKSVGELDIVTVGVIILLMLIVWAIEPTLKRGWEHVCKRQWRYLLLVFPLTALSVVLTAEGLNYLSVVKTKTITKEFVDISRVESLETELDSLKAFEQRLSNGEVRAFTNSKGVLYESGIIKTQQIQEDKIRLNKALKELKAQLETKQLRFDQQYEEKVQDFELFVQGFSGVFQGIAIVLIFLMNYKPVVKPVVAPKATPISLKTKLDNVAPSLKKKYRRTIFNPKKHDLVLGILQNEAKGVEQLSIRHLAASLGEKAPNVQNYRRYLQELGVI